MVNKAEIMREKKCKNIFVLQKKIINGTHYRKRFVSKQNKGN